MRVGFWLSFILLIATAVADAQTIGSHEAQFNMRGVLLPWTSWQNAVDREMKWYLSCPVQHGYPRFVWMTFMTGDYKPVAGRSNFIPAMQNGMGIISWLKYYVARGRSNARVLGLARAMGDYLVKNAVTPDSGKYPRFPRSTAASPRFPLPPDCGSQGDEEFEIEPDKGGIAGYALAMLYEETRDVRYRDQALHIARVLLSNMRSGSADRSPWPFRTDFRTGAERGPVSGNMTYILRLFDWMLANGYREVEAPRAALWTWIKNEQIPSARKDGRLWAQFYEDHAEPDNRTAWAPLNLARYILERREALDPDWRNDARALIDFVNNTFVSVRSGFAICGEQDRDRQPWGGTVATWGAVLAMYAAATESVEFKLLANQALTLCIYSIDFDGCPHDSLIEGTRGGWQEDAHTDKIHNILDALVAFPEWGK